MKILWLKSDFLHPTTKGGQIRTLEMLRRLRAKHEVHYIAFHDGDPDALAKASEYSTRAYPIASKIRDKRSPMFAVDLVRGIFDPAPVALARYRSEEMKKTIADTRSREKFDVLVSDFIFPALNIPDLERFVVFSHNVEASIWQRHADTASNPVKKAYMRLQASKMLKCEGDIYRRAKHVIAVSPHDAKTIQSQFGVRSVSAVATGVDCDYFRKPPGQQPTRDLVFVGSMDWLPNSQGIRTFVERILPLIREKRPGCTFTITGRKPPEDIQDLAKKDPLVEVTGTVPDVRPYLWNARVSIVPLYVGGGTRLKIYESMAALTPVVSTTVGAEGLEIHPPRDIRIADTPEAFAAACLELLGDDRIRDDMATAGLELVQSKFSWDVVTREFERMLMQ